MASPEAASASSSVANAGASQLSPQSSIASAILAVLALDGHATIAELTRRINARSLYARQLEERSVKFAVMSIQSVRPPGSSNGKGFIDYQGSFNPMSVRRWYLTKRGRKECWRQCGINSTGTDVRAASGEVVTMRPDLTTQEQGPGIMMRISLQRSLTGELLTQTSLSSNDRVMNLRQAAWNALLALTDKRRYRTKRRRRVPGVIKLAKGSKVLHEHLALAHSGIVDGDVILVTSGSAPNEIRQTDTPMTLARQFVDWLKCFIEEYDLVATGCQRVETHAAISLDLDEGDSSDTEADAADEANDANSGFMRFVSIQTDAALPPPTAPRWNGKKKRLMQAGLNVTMRPPRLQQAWQDVASSVFRGKPPPLGTSIIAAYVQQEFRDPSDQADLLAIIRSPVGYSAFVCSASSEAMGDGLTAHLRGGLREEHLQLAIQAAEAALTPQWQPPSRQRSRIVRASSSPKAAFERVLQDVVCALLHFPLTTRGRSGKGLATELGRGVSDEKWDMNVNPEENDDPWGNMSDTSDASYISER